MTATRIEWTDATWNPVVGCSHASPGCDHCYAETMAGRLRAMRSSWRDISRPRKRIWPFRFPGG